MFAEVLLKKTTKRTDKIFHYSIPPDLAGQIKIGHEVVVPFGRRRDVGLVVGFVEKADVAQVKDIIKLVDEKPALSPQQIELARWIADYYYCFLSVALRTVVGAGGKTSNFKPQTSKQVPNPNIQLPIPELTQEQNQALEPIKKSIDNNQAEKFLLYGVTGSGKTEVYMQATDYVLKKGKSAIILVPEIGLTPQLVERFAGRFGDQIAVLHSHLSLKQRREEWARILSGAAPIVLGARSAIFAPLNNLGLIVLDEEYENTYKQDQSPRYHAREVAFFLAQQHQAVVVLGTATPSIETYYHAEMGAYKKLVLSQRIDNRILPPVEIVDMRRDRGWLLSEILRAELQQTLERKQQAILFINRRGFFTFVICGSCGLTVECPHCAVALGYHSSAKKLLCHRCGFSMATPTSCQRCNSTRLQYVGSGTQRIENEVAQLCPTARIIRYDVDSSSKRGSHEEIFNTFAAGQADILIGTQLVTKGLDVANVTLVGVISADTALHLPDFRAAEHTFQLLTQVAGRAGRHHLPGKVIIQTYNPEHYAIQAAARHDYESFYRQEIEHRRELNYPPFSKLISIMVSGKEENKVIKIIKEIGEFLKRRRIDQILGPAPALIPRMRGLWRYQLYIKSNSLRDSRSAIRDTMEKVVVPVDIKVAVDVEPMGMG